MALDGKLLARARDALQARREENAALLERREREARAKIPGLRETEDAQRALVGEILRLTAARQADAAALERIQNRSGELTRLREELLTAAGYPADWLDEIVTCPRCGDKGYLRDGSRCACLSELYESERARELSEAAGIGEEQFSGFDLGYYPPEDRVFMELNLEACREYAVNFGRKSPNLLFQGGTGLGKTYLSGCIAGAVSRRGFSVVYETAQGAFAAFEAQKFSRDGETYHAATERVERILACDLLILDDLGTELTTSFTQSALYNILNTRLNERRQMIVSTNLSDGELAARYIPQTRSRLLGEFDLIPFRGKDIRAIRKRRRYK